MGESTMNVIILVTGVFNVLVAAAVALAALVPAFVLRRHAGASKGAWLVFATLLLMAGVVAIQVLLAILPMAAGYQPWIVWLGRLFQLGNVVLMLLLGAGLGLLRPIAGVPHG
jgi:hypothetical protein